MSSNIVQTPNTKQTQKIAKKLVAMDKYIQIFMQENLDTRSSQKGHDMSTCFLFVRIFTRTLYPLHLEALLLQNGKFIDIHFQTPLPASRYFNIGLDSTNLWESFSTTHKTTNFAVKGVPLDPFSQY